MALFVTSCDSRQGKTKKKWAENKLMQEKTLKSCDSKQGKAKKKWAENKLWQQRDFKILRK